jgi:hypothetical protein
MEAQAGIPHQRLSDFLNNPERVSERTFQRIVSALESPTLEQVWSGPRVTYFDAPVMTSERLSSVRIPPTAVAFRFVVETDDERYQGGMRSTEWLADFDRIDELADAVPGGRDAIGRVVFDTGS